MNAKKITWLLLIIFIVLLFIALLPHMIVYGAKNVIIGILIIIVAIIIFKYLNKLNEKENRRKQDILDKLHAELLCKTGPVRSGLNRYPGEGAYIAISPDTLYFLSCSQFIICGEILKSSIKYKNKRNKPVSSTNLWKRWKCRIITSEIRYLSCNNYIYKFE